MEKSLIVQSDRTIMVETNSQDYDILRDQLLNFAELIKTPNYFHTYKITNLSLWNAASLGLSSQNIIAVLEKHSKYPIPANIQADIQDIVRRYGLIILEKDNLSGQLVLLIKDPDIVLDLSNSKEFKEYIEEKIDDTKYVINTKNRGSIKQFLIKVGYPVHDLAGYNNGNHFEIEIKNITKKDRYFELRDYQIDAVKSFYQDGNVTGGSGVILLPCGAGKTVIAMGIMELLSQDTLIICSSTVAVKQWISELIDKTTLTKEDIGEYSGEVKEIKPITITTYQILCYRKSKENEDFPHFDLFNSKHWGLIVYDEVHLLPAPIFRETAKLQSIRRLGLTATLIREDGGETDVFSLIGSIKYNMPWLSLQEQGWIATAECNEIRVKLDVNVKSEYYQANKRKKFRIASENPLKYDVLLDLLAKHKNDNVLIIAQYLDQLDKIAKYTNNLPIITGKTPNKKRLDLYSKFNQGEINTLIVSKIANYAVDLPSANVMIQLSGSFGSRQEEAQRLGRILRPKDNNSKAHFYSIVTEGTVDEDFAQNRQLFLVEQGYRYNIQYH